MEKNWHFHFLLLICHEFAWSCECPAAKSSGCFTDTPPESVLKTLIDSAEDRASSRPANHSVFAVSTDRPNGWVLSNCSSVFALFFSFIFWLPCLKEIPKYRKWQLKEKWISVKEFSWRQSEKMFSLDTKIVYYLFWNYICFDFFEN